MPDTKGNTRENGNGHVGRRGGNKAKKEDKASLTGRSKTNDTTQRIVEYLTRNGFKAWRQNVLPIPLVRGGSIIGFRSGSMSGLPDVISISANIGGLRGGLFFGVEVKTGKDKLRDAQSTFIADAQKRGAIVLIVKDYEDFLMQFKGIITPPALPPYS